ncbi:hypothetical protein GCM10022204_21100 [Microlunatus aurantiacus]|uniref:ABC transporter domain-containing protein n=1 Tax=Microlunatus aurantiacus TaxID=446786 RepID=A0ABP7DI90_9ACTN
MIQFESVSKTFRDGTTAVDDLSLTVPSGQITVIVGPSGCGKTTTLRMVNRMLEPSKGKVTWDGKPIKSRRKTALRRQMGYVIQSGGLFPHRTVLENIATVPDLQRWDRQKSRKRAIELLGSVGLDRKLGDRYPAQLSGGQQQRVGVARALAADPLVLLMDEPFSAVDPVVRGELHEFFLALQRDLSKTIIMITHDIDEAIKLGDQVAILRVGGRLAQVGTPQQLLDEPADAFVEGFVGRDRGYRSLSFQPASGLTLGGVQVVREAGYSGGDEPVLVVDGDARPVGWSDPSRPGTMLALGATFDAETDSLRTALDAALTSPVGLAVAVSGGSHRYAGVVDADMILRQVTQTRARIAESIAVRAHDEQPLPVGPATAGPSAEGGSETPRGPGAGDETAAGDRAAAGEDLDATSIRDDSDATSVRGVPPVAAVGTVGAVSVAGVVAAQSADEDPDATRISGPLPADDVHAREDEESAAWSRPDDAAADQPWSAADATSDKRWSAAADDALSSDRSGQDRRQLADDTSDPTSAGPEPYGSEVPPAGDESIGTAYDRQLAEDDESWSGAAGAPDDTPGTHPAQPVVEPPVAESARADDSTPPPWPPRTEPGQEPAPDDPSQGDGSGYASQTPPPDPYDTPLSPTPDPSGVSGPFGGDVSQDDHDLETPAPAPESRPAEDPAPADGPAPVDRQADDDHERGWPR